MRSGSLFLALAVTLLASTTAHAGAFDHKDRSARAQGLSYAGATAGSGGIQSMGFNPAALGTLEAGAHHFAVAGGLALRDAELEGQPRVGAVAVGPNLDAGEFTVTGYGYGGYRITDQISLGFSIYQPFSLDNSHPAGWLGQFDALKTELTTVSFSPSIAYEPCPGLTLALAWNILDVEIDFTSASITLDQLDSTEMGFSLGILWEALEGTTVGAAYHHRYEVDVGGQLIPTGVIPLPAHASFDLPAVFSLGLVQELNDDIRLMFEFQWQDWSDFDRINQNLDNGLFIASEVQSYDDSFFVALGGELDLFEDCITLRSGLAWDQTPTNRGFPAATAPPPANPLATNRSARVPDEDQLSISFGGSWRATKNLTFDLAYSYRFALDDPEVGLRTAPAGASIRYDADMHVVAMGATISF